METRRTQSCWFWSIFGPNLLLENPKYCQKTKIFPKTTSLWLSNNKSPRSQINHRILINFIKKNVFGAKNGLFEVKNTPVNKDQEVRDQVSTRFLEAPNSGLTLHENFCCSSIKTCVIPVLVSFFLFSYPLFWLWAHF